MKNKLGENKFKELEAEVVSKAIEIVKKMLEKSSV
jgi:hypothetical protein